MRQVTYEQPPTYIMMTEVQLRSLLAETVQMAINDLMNKPKLVDKHGAMEILCCKELKLLRLCKYGYLHPIKQGNKNMYDPDEVRSLLGKAIKLPQY